MRNLFFLLLLWGMLPSCSGDEPTANNRGAKGVYVEYAIAKSEPFAESLLINGSIQPYEEVMLRSEVNARIIELGFEEGDAVKKGQLLVRMDDRDIQAELSKTEVLYEQAKKESKRRESLLDIKAVSQEEYDQALNRVKDYKASIDQLKARIDQYRITAPFEGKVGLRSLSVGAFVSPGEALAQLVMDHPLKLEFALPERHASNIRVGDTVFFSTRNAKDKHSAVVYALESRIDPATRSRRVRASFPNKKGEFVAGSYAEVEVEVGDRDKASIFIPSQALLAIGESKKVFLIQNGKAVQKDVKIGVRREKDVLLESGISEGDTVAMTGLLYLRDGSSVILQHEGENKEKVSAE